MAKKVQGSVKLQLPAGKATPAPPVGTALGPHGVNIMDFCKQYNAKTSKEPDGMIFPVIVTIYSDRTFTFILKTPPASVLLKRAANIAKEAPAGELVPPASVQAEVHPSEQKVFDAFQALKLALGGGTTAADYERALTAIAAFAPILAQFFEDIFVMVEDLPLRNNRLRLMRETHVLCSRFANFNLLVKA